MGFQKVAKIADLWSGEMMGLEVNGERVCWSTLTTAFTPTPISVLIKKVG